MASNIIEFPDYVALKNEVDKLRIEISMLVLERDELLLVECKNIEMEYMIALGNLEYKAYELNCAVLRLKRKIELMRSKKNRQESIVLSDIENILDREFEEYINNLDKQLEKMNEALQYSDMEFLSDEESREIKKLYRAIVKVLHPDLNPEATEAEITLFQNAVSAYERGDLKTLRIISVMVLEPAIPESSDDSMTVLIKEKERLNEVLQNIREKIIEIKDSYPYNLKELLIDDEKVEEKKAELEQIIIELREALEIYQNKIDEMLR